MSDKIKINLNGAAETMLQSFYARAQYSKSKKLSYTKIIHVDSVYEKDYAEDFNI